MKLYQLRASNFQTFFGTPDQPILRESTRIIAQRPDCSAFLLLSDLTDPVLELQTSIPSGFDFTYCQEWGLTITEEVIHRVIRDLRQKDYGTIGDQLDVLWHAMDAGQMNKVEPFYSNIQSVKTRWTKWDR